MQNADNRPFKVKYRIYLYPVIAAMLVTMFFHPAAVHGGAMLPGISDGEVVVIVNHTYSSVRGAPEFQQVVAFKDGTFMENGDGKHAVRRVIGLPGDRIEIKDSQVYRNGKLLKEDYITGKTAGDVGPVTVGKDEVFVLGDNREQSVDSRDPRIGLLKLGTIRGWCAVAVWPLNEIGKVK